MTWLLQYYILHENFDNEGISGSLEYKLAIETAEKQPTFIYIRMYELGVVCRGKEIHQSYIQGCKNGSKNISYDYLKKKKCVQEKETGLRMVHLEGYDFLKGGLVRVRFHK